MINHLGFSKGQRVCLDSNLMDNLWWKLSLNNSIVGTPGSSGLWGDLPWEKALINATPNCHSSEVGCGWWAFVGWHATGCLANGVFRAPLTARHSVFPRWNPADSQLAFLHKFPPYATLRCGISISDRSGPSLLAVTLNWALTVEQCTSRTSAL